jgi:hypothetical protein
VVYVAEEEAKIEQKEVEKQETQKKEVYAWAYGCWGVPYSYDID